MLILPAPPDKPLCLSYSDDSECLYIGCRNGRILSWDRRRLQVETVFEHRDRVAAVKLAAGTNRNLAVAFSREIWLVDPGTGAGELIAEIGLGSGLVANGPLDRLCYTAHGVGRLFSHSPHRPNVQESVSYPGDPLALAATPSAPWLLLGHGRGDRGGVYWWRIDSPGFAGGGAFTLRSPVCSAAVSARGDRLALGTRSGRVTLLDPEAEGPTKVLGSFLVTAGVRENDRHRGVFGLAFLADGHELLTVSSDGDAQRWDADSQRPCHRLDWQMGSLRALAFAPDGQTAAAIGETNEIVVWDV